MFKIKNYFAMGINYFKSYKMIRANKYMGNKLTKIDAISKEVP